jgi:hypothetical protein
VPSLEFCHFRAASLSFFFVVVTNAPSHSVSLPFYFIFLFVCQEALGLSRLLACRSSRLLFCDAALAACLLACHGSWLVMARGLSRWLALGSWFVAARGSRLLEFLPLEFLPSPFLEFLPSPFLEFLTSPFLEFLLSPFLEFLPLPSFEFCRRRHCNSGILHRHCWNFGYLSASVARRTWFDVLVVILLVPFLIIICI